MKNPTFLIIAIICISISSCKKDFDLDDALVNMEPEAPEFYAMGMIEDQVNGLTVPFSFVSTDLELNFIASDSNQGLQKNTDTKFALSVVGVNNPIKLIAGGAPANDDIMVFINNGLAVKIVSDLPLESQFPERFTREELLNLFEVDATYSFGSEPGQVEIAFDHPDIEGFSSFSERGYHGLSIWSPDVSEDTFEILSVEEYQDPVRIDAQRGILITARINCTLGDSNNNLLNLREVEATFLFLYDQE